MKDEKPPGVALDDADWRIVCSSAMFGEVDRAVLARLCEIQRPLQYAAHQLIFSQGDRADGFFLVLEGWVKLLRITPAGHEAIVGAFTRGESFAEAVFFLGGVYPASAQAASSLRLLRIDAARFNEAMAQNADLAATLLGSVVQHTERLFDEIATLKLLSSPRRLADFLVRQTQPGDRQATIVLPHDKAMLAGRLGMTPESLSRALATLRGFGVTNQRDDVLIDDVERLASFARPSRRGARA